MRTGIMQAYFFPYLGYFQLINAVDTFVLYGDVSFRKKSWITKNRILDKGLNIPVDINVPVIKKSANKTINQIEINGTNWKKLLLKSLYFNYKKATYFNEIYTLIEKCIETNINSLHIYNSAIIIEICNYLEIKTNIIYKNDMFLDLEHNLLFSSCLKEERRSLRIIQICNTINANTYINPIGGLELYKKEFFESQGVLLNFINTTPYSYTQFNKEFIMHLSIIDVLMHNGKESTKELINNYTLI